MDSPRDQANNMAAFWLWTIVFVLMGGGAIFLSHFVQPAEYPPALTVMTSGGHTTTGSTVYDTYCAACHGPDGKSDLIPGLAPPLVNSPVMQGPTEAIGMTMLHGVQPDGTYTGVMVGWAALLSDDQIADVLTYVRTNFNNDPTPFTPGEIAWARAKYSGRTRPFTRSDIQAVTTNLPGAGAAVMPVSAP